MLKGKVLALLLYLLFLYGHTFSQNADTCVETEIASIRFNKNSVRLTTPAKKLLDSSFLIIKNHPSCSVNVLVGNFERAPYAQQAWDRVLAVGDYLIAKKISSNRIIFRSGEISEPTIVKLLLVLNESRELSSPPPLIRKH